MQQMGRSIISSQSQPQPQPQPLNQSTQSTSTQPNQSRAPVEKGDKSAKTDRQSGASVSSGVGGGAVVDRAAEAEKERELVQQLLDHKEYADRVAAECFAKNDRFLAAIKEAFEAFLNERQNKPAEMLGTPYAYAYIFMPLLFSS